MQRALFLDRDGVINKKALDGEYITRWADFHFLPGVVEAVARINRAGARAIVITNQRCVGKGLMTMPELAAIHRRMSESLAEHGARIDAIYCCPHETHSLCGCRKPAPAMFFDAARDYEINLKESWMIGDSEIDIEAGKNAGCSTALLLNRTIDDPGTNPDYYGADIVCNSLNGIIDQILHSAAEPEMRTGALSRWPGASIVAAKIKR